jgi:hypothetical protein
MFLFLSDYKCQNSGYCVDILTLTFHAFGSPFESSF